MFYAENILGLGRLLQRLRHHDAEARKRYKNPFYTCYKPAEYFAPAKLLEECVFSGRRLDDVLQRHRGNL